MEEIKYTLYLLKDSFGNKVFVVSEDPSDTVGSFTLKDTNGNEHSFESQTYHLQSYCDEHGIDLKRIEREESFDALWSLPSGNMTLHVK